MRHSVITTKWNTAGVTNLENLNCVENNRNQYSSRWIALEKEIYQYSALTFIRSSNVRDWCSKILSTAHVALADTVGKTRVSKGRGQKSDYAQTEITVARLTIVGIGAEVSKFVGLATPFVPRARQCKTAKTTETFVFFLNELSNIGGETVISPSFWTFPYS